ncbi:DUF7269 family protein [Haloterrigena alkaliphila]|uniref:Uncharacterized protein n=1 Tax=Haloterrigena alkaliphila TaxID=2816475 RepID=A0A8A2VHL9_9EURY|nr:hypothetical protein [Haloterrigena alkaliphila]QSX00158.1 hypothetical protein J0X25_04100 [Haloterrigena alkaliphila]
MSRTPSTTGLALLTLPAAVLVAVGGVLAVRPALLLERVPELETLLASVDPGTVVFALVILLVLFAPTLGLAGRLRRSGLAPLVDDASDVGFDDSSGGRRDRRAAVGGTIDDRIALATAYDDEPRDVREAARERLLESLRPIAATAYANRAGVADEEATAAIEAGTWTDEPRAAAFLAGSEGPSTPLWLWLLDLLRTADPFVAHLETTIDEIERLQSSATVAAPRSELAGDSSSRIEPAEDSSDPSEATAGVAS